MSAPVFTPPQGGFNYEWWAGEGDAPKVFEVSATSREDAIRLGWAEFGRDTLFTIVEASQDGDFIADIFDSDDIRCAIGDRFAEVNGARWGEDGWTGFETSAAEDKQLADMLAAAFKVWLDFHGKKIPTVTFTDQRNREVIRPLVATRSIPAEILRELLITPLDTGQVIGKLGLVGPMRLFEEISRQLRDCGFERYILQTTTERRRYWIPSGLTEAQRRDRALAAAGWEK